MVRNGRRIATLQHSLRLDEAAQTALVQAVTAIAAFALDNRKQLLRIEISIDIEQRQITAGGMTLPFQMDNAAQAALICGGDETLDTLEFAQAIRNFEAKLTEGMRVSVIK